ncbi:inner membrane protein [Escherichia coli]|nr:inner membrane protein [Escherichia coli]SQP63651.1 inner membrane protein [Escherichia coli]SQZ47569.1 inner membrane protein [Escherichia coli]SQZ83546.1 inner membrane protein [Escherichia coli]
MKWQQRVRVATGLSCWQIMLHLLVVALLVVGWMSKTLVHVGVGLCALYCGHGSDDAGVSAPPRATLA